MDLRRWGRYPNGGFDFKVIVFNKEFTYGVDDLGPDGEVLSQPFLSMSNHRNPANAS